MDAVTTEQLRLLPRAIILAVLGILLTSCAGNGALRSPEVLVAPYESGSGELVWAVAPLRNESGVSRLDSLAVADQLVAAIEQTRGLRALPVNRVIETMRALDMRGVSDEGDARKLARALGADAILVGSITAWDPYDPPVIGLSVALYAEPGALSGRVDELDPRQLSRLSTEYHDAAHSRFGGRPVNIASDHLDARDHGVLMELRDYARGRSDPESALDWKIYTASMELFTQFAAHHTVRTLLDNEWVRLSRVAHADD
ncbi:MAG: hypothetical protein R3B57_12230 [Phycisphaerales bacterium]